MNDDLSAKIGLEPRTITFEDYQAATPEKIELWQGYLLWEEGERRRLLQALLVNVGLCRTVALAPRELWLQALEQSH